MRYFLSVVFLLAFTLSGLSNEKEKIRIDAENEPLNVVLVKLRQDYNIQLSYSDNLLSKHKITLHETFNSEEAALRKLLHDFPLAFKKSGDVFIIIPKKKKKEEPKKAEPKNTTIIGQVLESGSFEPLPFSHVIINNQPMVSDVKGSFAYTASANPNINTGFRVQISHLGYFILDTTLFENANHRFLLTPQDKWLPEILVQNNVVEKAQLIGEQSGNMKLNNSISRFLPGAGDNSVFNLLRLMPGVMAAGEQSSDLLIWGSYESHSQVIFDGYTIYGLKNFNDNISAVNPFMTKNIEIFKGGYEAKYGNRVGGIVNITGKNGNMIKPALTLNINNTTINGMVEIPVFKKSSLVLAYRQTYYNLYDSIDFNVFAPTEPKLKSENLNTKSRTIEAFDVNAYPDNYTFSDANIKYSFNFDNGDLFYVSSYWGRDDFLLKAENEVTKTTIKTRFARDEHGRYIRNNNHERISEEYEETTYKKLTINDTEENNQYGFSAYYGKNWNNGNTTTLTYANSGMQNKTGGNRLVTNITSDTSDVNVINTFQNNIGEQSIKIENSINVIGGNKLQFGLGYHQDNAYSSMIKYDKEMIETDTIIDGNLNRLNVYVQHKQTFNKLAELKVGVRANYLSDLNRFMLEPRIGASLNLVESLKVNASWGIFNQFVYKLATVDQFNNYTYAWTTANDRIPVLKANHSVIGLSYNKNGLSINVEGFYKTTDSLSRRKFETRIVRNKELTRNYAYVGDGRSKGIDFYIRKELGAHALWASYSLSKAEERMAYFNETPGDYTLAPHDQRHEFKIAGLFKIKKFYLSGNYVYGSGMQVMREILYEETDDVSYSRFDASVTYKYTNNWMNGELGLSVLNIFNTANLKQSNVNRIYIDQDFGSLFIYTNAVPFTPTLFLKLAF